MDKEINKYSDVSSKLLFYRSGKSYYFRFDSRTYEVNLISINKLKEQLTLPYKVDFSGLSRVQVQKIVGILLDGNISYGINKIDTWANILRYEAIFYQSKRVVDAYKIPNISSLYGRSCNCNPYLLNNIGSSIVLMEVTKDYPKNNDGEYYFLGAELSHQEREFFDECYVKLECDYVYNLNMYNNIDNKKRNSKLLRKKRI